ncbi:hypothetical protein ABL78_3789 [Leptomonas seymouri]|uniref:BRCT domain-containing protein n=1 Tax=Leptomonas seymouri TaxID=5684 RepID=A0A0N0P625_LEPSE|nr:hypothetical protein ABL78_3789 [Leptomonas seymouri]|eukprot:KPI87136.1 hypothetical protein ABL78_3789 [Leptomonas seymouri]
MLSRGCMRSQTLSSKDGAVVDSAVPVRGSATEPSAAEEIIDGQGRVLFALHNDLCQHQKCVNQAFITLDQACRELVASVATRQFIGPNPQANAAHAAPSANTSHGTTATAASSSASNARRFAQLLRQVEALHQFLFTNLYVHQRECALQLLVGVERFVLGVADSSDGAEASGNAGGLEELRHQVAQLRYRLSSAPHSHWESRVALPVEASPRALPGAACAPPPHTSSSAPAIASDTSVSSPSSSWPVAGAPCYSADANFTQTVAAFSCSALPPSRAPLRSQLRLFALSSHFTTLGADGQRSLFAVLRVAQLRFRIHGVVLSSTGPQATSPTMEIQLAMQLGCLCLVIPHQYRKMYSVASPIPIPTDRDVLLYNRGNDDFDTTMRGAEEGGATGFMPPATPPPPLPSPYSDSDDEGDLMGRDADARTSALEQLFLSLEADLPEQTADVVPPWLPIFADQSDAAADGMGTALVVQRAALKRERGPLAHRVKRLRLDTHSHPSASSTSAAVAASMRRPSGSLMEPFCSFTETTVHAMQPDEPANDALHIEHDSNSLPLIMESQHIGCTQQGPVQLSSDSAVPACLTPPSAMQPEASDETPAETAVPPRPLFQISNSVKYLKSQLLEAIEQLGGVVDLSSSYCRDCNFLVAAEGITERTEKYLGACAAAAYIVPPRYVFDSKRRGYWLTNRVHEYDMSPQRVAAHQPRPPPIFRNWRVVLITCRSAAARGVRAALLAGGCTQVTAFVVDLTAEAPISASARAHVYDEKCAVEGVVEGVCATSVISSAMLASATHILVECSSVTAQGYFQLPDWVPVCVRRAEYASRIFTLELLYFCLCSHPERLFDSEGLLCDEEALTPACRVEPT